MDNTTPTEETLHRTLNHYALISFKDAYWSLSSKEREEFHKNWLNGLRAAAQKVDIFQATESGIDLIVWSALPADGKQDAAVFFEKFARCQQTLSSSDRNQGFTVGLHASIAIFEGALQTGDRSIL